MSVATFDTTRLNVLQDEAGGGISVQPTAGQHIDLVTSGAGAVRLDALADQSGAGISVQPTAGQHIDLVTSGAGAVRLDVLADQSGAGITVQPTAGQHIDLVTSGGGHLRSDNLYPFIGSNLTLSSNSGGNLALLTPGGGEVQATQANVTTLKTDTIQDSTGAGLTFSVTGDIAFNPTGELKLNPTNDVSMESNRIVNVADPTAAQDAATKAYVDNLAQGLTVKDSVLAATTADVGATGGTAQTLTGAGALPTIDGETLSVSDRVLVKNQGTTAENGIYEMTQLNPFILTRVADQNDPDEFAGAFVFVLQGSTQADTGWVCTTDPPVTVGTTPITWTRFTSAAALTAGDGINIVSNAVEVDEAYPFLWTGNQTQQISVLSKRHLASTQVFNTVRTVKAQSSAVGTISLFSVDMTPLGNAYTVFAELRVVMKNVTNAGGAVFVHRRAYHNNSNPTELDQGFAQTYTDLIGIAEGSVSLTRSGFSIVAEFTQTLSGTREISAILELTDARP